MAPTRSDAHAGDDHDLAPLALALLGAHRVDPLGPRLLGPRLRRPASGLALTCRHGPVSLLVMGACGSIDARPLAILAAVRPAGPSGPVTTYNYPSPEGVPLPMTGPSTAYAAQRGCRSTCASTACWRGSPVCCCVILVFIGLPLKYLADVPAVDAIVGVAHGVFFFPAYVVSTLVVGYRRTWSIIKILVVAACGVIPFGSFVAEHRIVQEEALRAAPLDVQP